MSAELSIIVLQSLKRSSGEWLRDRSSCSSLLCRRGAFLSQVKFAIDGGYFAESSEFWRKTEKREPGAIFAWILCMAIASIRGVPFIIKVMCLLLEWMIQQLFVLISTAIDGCCAQISAVMIPMLNGVSRSTGIGSKFGVIIMTAVLANALWSIIARVIIRFTSNRMLSNAQDAVMRASCVYQKSQRDSSMRLSELRIAENQLRCAQLMVYG